MPSLFEAYGLMDAAPPPAPPAPRKPAGVLRTIGDMGVKAAQGVVDLGQSVVGLGTLATGGMVGKGMRAIGYDPEATNTALGQLLSPDQRESEAAVQGAEGFGDTLMAAFENPRAIAGSVFESLPSMMAAGGLSGAVAKQIAAKAAAPLGGLGTAEGAAAGSAAVEAAATKLIWAGSGAEGAQSAGQIADQAQGAGRSWSQYAAPALAAGLGTAAIGRASGKLMGDAETALFTGAKSAGVQGTLPARIAKGVLGEGGEELLQSGQEQAWTNVAMDKPVGQGVGNAAAMGAVTGAAMGGTMGAVSPHHAAATVRATETVPEVGTLSKAANVGTEEKAQAMENAPPAPAPAPPPTDPVYERILQLDGTARTEALQAYAIINRPDVPKGVRQYNSKLLDQHLATLEPNPLTQGGEVPKLGYDPTAGQKPLYADTQGNASPNQNMLQPQIGFDNAPTGDMVAGPDGVRPQTEADRVNADQRALELRQARDAEEQRQVELGLATPGAKRASAEKSGDVQATVPVQNPVEEPDGAAAPGLDPGPDGARDPVAAGPSADAGSRTGAPERGTATAELDHQTGTVAGEAGRFKTLAEAQAYISQQRRAGGTEIHALPLPQDDGSFSLALKDSPDYPKAEAFKKTQELRDAGVKEGDLLTKAGGIFLNRLAASRTLKKAGDNHEVVPVKGGFVVRLKDVQAFQPNTGTLGVARAEMPQIKSEHHGALVNFLNARDITHETVEVDPTTLKPTQAEFSLSKVDALVGHEGERSILVSSDGHVLDGHHQWIAAGAESKPVKVIRLNAPVKDLLPLAREFPSAQTAPQVAEQASKPVEKAEVARGAEPAAIDAEAATQRAAGTGDGRLGAGNDAIVRQETKPAIVDTGEKIGGARKDRWKERGLREADLEGMSGGEEAQFVTKDNIWPKADHAKLIAAGMEPKAAALLKVIRDRMAAQPRTDTPESRRQYLQAMTAVADAVKDIKNVADVQQLADKVKEAVGMGKGSAFTDPNEKKALRTFQSIYRGRHNPLYIDAMDRRKADQLLAEGWPAPKARETVSGDGKKTPERPHLDSVKRTGEDIRAGKDVTAEDFRTAFGFRGVEFGNWAAQDERQKALNLAYDALHDLAEVMGVPPKAISLHGRLGIGFGARGSGKAAAHYEPGKLVINMTKINGAGSLAHEWGHAMDHYFGELDRADAYQGRARGASGWYSKRVERGNLRSEMRKAFADVMDALFHRYKTKAEMVRSIELQLENAQAEAAKNPADPFYERRLKSLEQHLQETRGEPEDAKMGRTRSSYMEEAVKLSGSAAESGYWARPTEMFARAFESWVFDRLHFDDRVSQYLVQGVEPTRYAEGYKGNPYPAGMERVEIGKAFQHLVDTIQTKEDGDNTVMFSRRGDKRVAIPTAIIGGDLAHAQGHVDYTAAKSGDMDAALRLASDRVTPAMVEKVRTLIGDEKPIVVPVIAEETGGRNKIPHAVANALAAHLGLQEDGDIVQSRKVGRGAMDGLDRIFAQPEFDGPVQRGAKYLIVDDTLTQGGTFAALASHIEQGGGTVIGAVALTGKAYSAKIEASSETLQKLRNKHGDLEQAFRDATGYGFDALTESEARYLASYRPADAIRDRIAAEGRQGGAGEGPQAFRGVGQGQGLSSAEVQQAVAQLTRNWQRKPDIHVIDSIVDAPEAVFEKFAAQHSGGARGMIDGFHYKGDVYLVADMIRDEKHAAQVLYHEALGHFGLRGVFGESLNGILDQLAAVRPALLREKAGQYGLDLRKTKDRRAAAEELLAEMAQTRPDLGFVQRAITAIRAWLRANVPFFKDMKYTDADIIANFIVPARGYLERGRSKDPSFVDAAGDLAFSRTEDLDSLLEEHGQAISNSLDAERRWADGERIYALHEQSDEAHLVTSLEELRGYQADQLLALPEDDDLMFSRTLEQRAREAFTDLASTSKTFNTWNKTVGTQYQKAQQDAHFKRAFDAAQDYQGDISRLANDAADLARDLLPRMDRISDLLKDIPGIDKNATTRKDVDAIAKPIFQGTLADKRQYGAEELRRVFQLTDKQVDLYKQFRASVNKSLDDLTTTTAAKILRNSGFPAGMIEDEVQQGDHKALAAFAQQAAEYDAKLKGMAEQVQTISTRAEQLKAEGYAPLMRFGQYAVSLRDPKTNDLQEFWLFESERKANAKARELAERGNVEKSVMDTGTMKALRGVSPESLELFGDILEKAGLFDTRDEVYQEYLRKAIDQRSAMKRMIHREGFPGFSQDVRRVLATFVTSNARLASKNLHFSEMLEAVENIPKTKGDVRAEARKLVEYVQDPVEEAPAIRGLLFAQYIGGNVASAMVNMTQSLTMTLPYLSQFSNPAKAAVALAGAMKQAVTDVKDQELAAALARAEQTGVVSPQEIHHLNATSMATFGSNQAVQKGMFIWGSLFSLAEQFNRRTAFIAAWNTAVARGEQDPYAFGVKAVEETQGVYNRGNRPNWARGAIGATLFTFKQFSISYLEFLTRLPAREKALALAILFLASGAEGLPFADDLDDIIDTIAQRMGYNFNGKVQRRKFMEANLGQGLSEFLLKGVSSIPGMPIDISARMGMANLIPGTAALRKDTRDHMKDVLEIAGPAGSVVQDATKGEWRPTAIRNLAKGADMFQTGLYRDEKGRKVIDTDAVDATWKSIGFQPAAVAQESQKARLGSQGIELVKQREAAIAEEMAQARFEDDNAKLEAARAELKDWNETNPEARIVITQTQIRNRLREMHKSREERIVKSAPKELRSEVRAQLQ